MYADVVFGNDTGAVGGPLEGLFDGHLGYEVEVDVFGDIQDGFLDKEGGVECDV